MKRVAPHYSTLSAAFAHISNRDRQVGRTIPNLGAGHFASTGSNCDPAVGHGLTGVGEHADPYAPNGGIPATISA